ncbi:MAG: nitrogenase iron-molybdenum cofactor biosynthesis protein NifE, partial [Nitrospinae bacterium]|nr:nitrogenase iron-molybdenum cofactor biosynthesis protein NifE [Nitrospinota bacterium]
SIIRMAELMDDEALLARARAVLDEERARVEPRIATLRAKLSGKRVLLYTGGVKSWSIISALQELGMTVIATGTKKSTEEDKARIVELMGEDAHMIEEGAPEKLLKIFRDEKADILLAGGRNQYTAVKARLPFVDVNQERHTPFTGFEGHVNLGRKMLAALESPAHALARRPDPFENVEVMA